MLYISSVIDTVTVLSLLYLNRLAKLTFHTLTICFKLLSTLVFIADNVILVTVCGTFVFVLAKSPCKLRSDKSEICDLLHKSTAGFKESIVVV